MIPSEVLAIYKPVGVDTDLAPGSDLARLISCVIKESKFHHVGRLDRDTSGLLLLSRDGALTNSILISARVPKTYLARVSSTPTPEQLHTLTDGVMLGDGFSRFTSASPVSQSDCCTAPLFMSPNYQSVEKENFFVRITTFEGRNRIVRRTLAAVGLPVFALHRESIGPIVLETGRVPGSVYPLTDTQVDSLVSLLS